MQHTDPNQLGRGRPHSEMLAAASGTSSVPPTIATLQELQKQFAYLVSLEFCLGNLDNLQNTQGDKPHGQHRD